MQVDFFTIARRRRKVALESLDRRQMELPGMTEPVLWKDSAYQTTEPELDLGPARPQVV